MEKFNESMEDELLKNDFAYYDDWKYGPVSGWSTDHEYYTLYLFKHNFGYWLIISCHASGTNPKMNIGSLNNADDIITVRDSLRKLW